MLIIIPFAFLELRPEAAKAALKNAQDWLLGHARQLMAYTALILGRLPGHHRPDTPELTCQHGYRLDAGAGDDLDAFGLERLAQRGDRCPAGSEMVSGRWRKAISLGAARGRITVR